MLKKILLGLIILVVILIAYNLIKQIIDVSKSGDRLSQSADTLFKLEAKNRELKAKLSQIKSSQYLEEQARNKLGLSKAGETIVVIPEEKIKQVLGISQSAQIRLPNWQGWLKLFWR